jgi:hypothetical protein
MQFVKYLKAYFYLFQSCFFTYAGIGMPYIVVFIYGIFTMIEIHLSCQVDMQMPFLQ